MFIPGSTQNTWKCAPTKLLPLNQKHCSRCGPALSRLSDESNYEYLYCNDCQVKAMHLLSQLSWDNQLSVETLGDLLSPEYFSAR